MDHEAKLNEVYRQRNSLAIALVKLTLQNGGTAGKQFEVGGTNGWGWVVYVDTPVGQLSWHMSPESVHLLDDLPVYAGAWDGTYLGRNNDWPLSWRLK